jgi:hypothetical protein
MKKQYGIVFLVALYANTGGANENSEKDKIVITKKEVHKKKIKKQKIVQKKQEITPYQLAQNISAAINFLIKHKDEMSDLEPLLRKRRDVAVDIYRAEGYCVLSMAAACFPQDIQPLINWNNMHPFLGKDVYSDGIKNFIDINSKYNNDSYYKAPQSEIARDKLREIVHENIFSIIDAINKIGSFLKDGFHYSGHVYEEISSLDHVALYDVLSDKNVNLSSLDACYHKWQISLYRNLILMLKLIAKSVEKAGMAGEKTLTDEDRRLLKTIAMREIGDENVALPSGICVPDQKLLEKMVTHASREDASEAETDKVQ